MSKLFNLMIIKPCKNISNHGCALNPFLLSFNRYEVDNFMSLRLRPIRVCPCFLHKPMRWFCTVSIELQFSWQILSPVVRRNWLLVDGWLAWWYTLLIIPSVSQDTSAKHTSPAEIRPTLAVEYESIKTNKMKSTRK